MTILDRIFVRKREELEFAKSRTSLAEMRELAACGPPPRGFLRSLKESDHQPALIAEVKKASPSEGVIRHDFDPGKIAEAYRRAGAACLSVLTDVDFFQGSVSNLTACRDAVDLPILRKDFTVEEYHVYEARAIGADAILLIAAMLDPSVVESLHGLARSLGMDVLVEVHNEQEAQIAVAMGADLIGVNNRDLSTFVTDLGTTGRLAPIISPHAFLVSESAMKSREDVELAAFGGAQGVLIGTTFCASDDIEGKVGEVMGW